jgi:predicted nucleic acid-binding protein
MTMPLLYDAVTLRHMALCGLLSACEAMSVALPGPRWTEAVRDELNLGIAAGHTECSAVVNQAWLGSPVVPAVSNAYDIYRIQIALNGGLRPPIGHAGEAQSIFFATRLNGRFATDDNAAYAFMERRLGVGRAIDTVGLLRAAVSQKLITAPTAAAAVMTIRNAGRHIRRIHPSTITDGYFV